MSVQVPDERYNDGLYHFAGILKTHWRERAGYFVDVNITSNNLTERFRLLGYHKLDAISPPKVRLT